MKIIPINIILLILFSMTGLNGLASEDNVNIKIEAEITKSGYEGETLTYEVKLYSTSRSISKVNTVSNPEFPAGCRVINCDVYNNSVTRPSGKGQYKYCWTILKKFIIPQSSGKYQIKGGTYAVLIPHERIVDRGFWGYSRMIDYEQLRSQSNSVDFKVGNLPKVSEQFAGCVGNFSIESWFPPGEIYKGQEAYAVIRISGYGSLQDLKVPSLYKIFQNGCQLREVDQNDELKLKDGKLYSIVTLTCKFIPNEDDFEINPLCLEFFNPETKKYYKSCSETLRWNGSNSRSKRGTTNKDAISI